MKKIHYSLLITLFLSSAFIAQENDESKNKIKTLKIAYLTEQLNLTPKEAQKFWPIYNVFDKEQHELRRIHRSELRGRVKSFHELDQLSENDAEKLIDLKLETDKKLYESQKDFVKKIEKIISAKKIIRLQLAEMEFGRKLMRKYRRDRPGPRN